MKPEGIIYNLLEDLKNNNEIELINSIKNTIDFINVTDVCRLILLLSNRPTLPRVLNLASGISVSINELVQSLKEILVSKSEIRNIENQCLPNKSNIDLTKLKSALEENELDFIPLRLGLINLVENSRGV